jgi:hypothetical protein
MHQALDGGRTAYLLRNDTSTVHDPDYAIPIPGG